MRSFFPKLVSIDIPIMGALSLERGVVHLLRDYTVGKSKNEGESLRAKKRGKRVSSFRG